MTTNSSSVNSFVGQFSFTRVSSEIPEACRAKSMDGWTLKFCSTLRCSEILSADARVLGWILGLAAEPEGRLSGTQVQIGSIKASPNVYQDLQRYISSLSGRFVACVSVDGNTRVYGDPSGQMGIVYSLDQLEVASSLFLISDVDVEKTELGKAFDIPKNDKYFPFGLTPDARVRRLLPNHFLDVKTFSQTRFWPNLDQIESSRGLPNYLIVQEIADRLRNNINAVANEYSLTMSLTAGQDSRALLAASRHHVRDIEFFTMRVPGKTAGLDCEVATRIASEFQLKHRVLDWQVATPAELNDWLLRCGYSGAGNTWRAVATLQQLDQSRVYLPGLCMETGRAAYWRKRDMGKIDICPEELVKRTGHPHISLVIEGARNWLGELPCKIRADILDLYFVEMRMGCWGGPNHYGHIHNLRYIPVSDRRIFELMLATSHEYRFNQKLVPDLLEILWPELLKYPFNRQLGVRGVFSSPIAYVLQILGGHRIPKW